MNVKARLYNQLEIVYHVLYTIPADQGKLIYYLDHEILKLFSHIDDTLELYHCALYQLRNTSTFDGTIIEIYHNIIVLMYKMWFKQLGSGSCDLQKSKFIHKLNLEHLYFNSEIYSKLHDDYNKNGQNCVDLYKTYFHQIILPTISEVQ